MWFNHLYSSGLRHWHNHNHCVTSLLVKKPWQMWIKRPLKKHNFLVRHFIWYGLVWVLPLSPRWSHFPFQKVGPSLQWYKSTYCPSFHMPLKNLVADNSRSSGMLLTNSIVGDMMSRAWLGSTVRYLKYCSCNRAQGNTVELFLLSTHLSLTLYGVHESVNRVSIGSDNGLSPIRRQAII